MDLAATLAVVWATKFSQPAAGTIKFIIAARELATFAAHSKIKLNVFSKAPCSFCLAQHFRGDLVQNLQRNPPTPCDRPTICGPCGVSVCVWKTLEISPVCDVRARWCLRVSIDVRAIWFKLRRPLHTASASRQIIYLSILTLLLLTGLFPGDLGGGLVSFFCWT